MNEQELRAAGYVPLDEVPEELRTLADQAITGPDGEPWFKVKSNSIFD